MKTVALTFVVTAMCAIAAIWLMIVEGVVAHVVSKSKLRRMHSALVRKV